MVTALTSFAGTFIEFPKERLGTVHKDKIEGHIEYDNVVFSYFVGSSGCGKRAVRMTNFLRLAKLTGVFIIQNPRLLRKQPWIDQTVYL